jgi:hypothetical protein
MAHFTVISYSDTVILWHVDYNTSSGLYHCSVTDNLAFLRRLGYFSKWPPQPWNIFFVIRSRSQYTNKTYMYMYSICISVQYYCTENMNVLPNFFSELEYSKFNGDLPIFEHYSKKKFKCWWPILIEKSACLVRRF